MKQSIESFVKYNNYKLRRYRSFGLQNPGNLLIFFRVGFCKKSIIFYFIVFKFILYFYM